MLLMLLAVGARALWRQRRPQRVDRTPSRKHFAMTSSTARNVLIVGASRGLGLEFVRQYRADGAKVTATARDDAGLARISALGAKALKLDVADAASAAGHAWQIDGEAFDTIFHVSGVYGERTAGLEPPSEGRLRQR